ncbi:MAG: protein kinase [Planctomycetota bacterium]
MTSIAILEDDETLRELMVEVLERRGYAVRAFDCVEAATALLKDPPDLLISDVQLADGNGVEFLERLRLATAEDPPQVFLISALGEEQDLLRGFDAGADDYLPKPVSMGELLAKVALALARKQDDDPACPDPSLPGGKLAFGRYRIQRVLGSGAFGTVFEAEDIHRRRKVALKVLHALRGLDLVHRQRFLREAYTLSLVRSPHVVGLYDFGEQEGRLYAALEFVEGPTLAGFVAREGAVGADDLRALLEGGARALEALEQQGLLHRDLKPENVVLRGGDPGDPVLIDFGLAKSTQDSMTEAGMLLGTPAFMAPEQIRAEGLDGRADQFALGLTVLYAATGVTAFPSEEGPALLKAQATRQLELPASLPPALAPVLERMTRLAPEARYPSALALWGALAPSPPRALVGA